jgi:hypothetical protein
MDIRDVKDLVSDLGWDYDRMSQSGKSIYDRLCRTLDIGDGYDE